MSYHTLRKIIGEMIVESNDIEIGGIYCDLDGVLVDFEVGAIDLLSKILDDPEDPTWTSDSRSMHSNIDRLFQEYGREWRPEVPADLHISTVRQIMRSAIMSSPGKFFSTLPPLLDGTNGLWPFLKGIENDFRVPVYILSAPIEGRKGSTAMSAAEGKRIWCGEHLRPVPTPESIIIATADEKPNWAITGDAPNVLIDDKPKTVSAWGKRRTPSGRHGIGVLHVTGDSASTMKELSARLGLVP